MPKRINNVKAQPNQLPNNSTIPVTLSFDGAALKDNAKFIVDFRISPYPELNFGGKERISAPYTFNKVTNTFTKQVNISNSNPNSPLWLNGYIALTATDIATGNDYYDYAAIVYQ